MLSTLFTLAIGSLLTFASLYFYTYLQAHEILKGRTVGHQFSEMTKFILISIRNMHSTIEVKNGHARIHFIENGNRYSILVPYDTDLSMQRNTDGVEFRHAETKEIIDHHRCVPVLVTPADVGHAIAVTTDSDEKVYEGATQIPH